VGGDVASDEDPEPAVGPGVVGLAAAGGASGVVEFVPPATAGVDDATVGEELGEEAAIGDGV